MVLEELLKDKQRLQESSEDDQQQLRQLAEQLKEFEDENETLRRDQEAVNAKKAIDLKEREQRIEQLSLALARKESDLNVANQDLDTAE